MTNEQISRARKLSALQFETSDVWNVVLGEIESFITSETAVALDQSTLGETRIHQCGRASSLSDLREHLLAMKQEAMTRTLKD